MSSPIRITQLWEGSTAQGVDGESTAFAAGKPPLPTSTDPSFGGDGGCWNPEDLYGAALSTCFMYTFLALARKVRIDVRRYEDQVDLELVTEDKRTRIQRATLSPTIQLAPGSSANKARAMFEKSHKYCVIANSSAVEIILAPVFVVQAA